MGVVNYSLKVNCIGDANDSLVLSEHDSITVLCEMFSKGKSVGMTYVTIADAVKIRDFLDEKIAKV